MEPEFTTVYDCPCCGQGGLEVVRIESSPPVEAVVCSECDSIWRSPRAVGLHNAEGLDAVLGELGVPQSWRSLTRRFQGVDWDRIDHEFQIILSGKSASRGQTAKKEA